jgi:hypothetical protein
VFEQAKAACREQSILLRHRSDPYVTERHSQRLGDRWRRGFIINMAELCDGLYGDRMFWVIAIFGNVAFDRNDLTAERVRSAFR